MSHPRMSVPGGTYMVTRTTAMSLFLLTPGPVVNQIMEYCLAWAARGRGILIHAVSVESNHYHIVVTDLDGRLSDFVQELNRCAARCLLEYYRARLPQVRLDSVWSSAQSFSDTLLLTTSAIFAKLDYVLNNPVKDGLVRDYRKWPGFNTRPSDWRKATRTVRRPAFYFKNTPEELSYRIEPPRQLDGGLEHVIANVEARLRDSQKQLARNLQAQGRSFLGEKAVLRTDPLDAPMTPRPQGNLNPRLSSGNDAKALQLGIRALRSFRLAYREAWQALKRGVLAVFPGGTLLMKRRFHVPCDPLDAACFCQLART
jgi:REP element-mobilizing transposase RayT